MTVAKENLLAAINTANEKLAQTDAYTPASLEALQNAVDEAQTVYNKADATQTEVDNAKANVEAKIAALKEKADKSALRLAVKAAEGEAALTDKYTEESIAALQTAIDAANRVLADDNATQAEVDAQVEAVNAAKAALEEKKAPVVKEELEKAVADATEVVGATDKYTEASLAALQSAIDAANEVLQNSDATQDEIDAAVQAVEAVDTCVGRMVDAILAKGGAALITADHGNADKMMEPDGSPFTAHTTNPVPLIAVGVEGELVEGGVLADLAPTMLDIMGVPQPEEMTGKSLLKK